MTDLKKFQHAYATMTVAAYEPLILRWISGWTLFTLSEPLVSRAQILGAGRLSQLSTALTLRMDSLSEGQPSFGDLRNLETRPRTTMHGAVDLAGQPIDDGDIRPVKLEGFPNAVMVGDRLYPSGILNVRSERPQRPGGGGLARFFGMGPTNRVSANTALGVQTLPVLKRDLLVAEKGIDYPGMRKQIFEKLLDAARSASEQPREMLASKLNDAIRAIGAVSIFQFWPPHKIEEALSPIGVAHFYRQLYFNAAEGVGPIEEAFTVAPLETLEVVYETVRRLVHEEIMESGVENVSEKAQEAKNQDEVSDKVSSMVQQDVSISMSADASGSVGVWEFGATTGSDLNTSAQQGRELASRRLQEVTTRASERITKSFRIKTRDLDEVTTTNLTRRVIKNESDHPVSYGLRRVLRRVRVKVQDLGPFLVWQLYVDNPGVHLVRSRFVHFPEEQAIAVPELPPGVPPRPTGGVESGTATTTVNFEGFLGDKQSFDLVIRPGPDRRINTVTIDSILSPQARPDDPAIVPVDSVHHVGNAQRDDVGNVYTVTVDIEPQSYESVIVNYTFTWEPSQQVQSDWETQLSQAQKAVEESLLKAQFERYKELITEKSKIRPRPANDLRREERYEVMSRVIGTLFSKKRSWAAATPLEIEFFHRYFNVEGMFMYTHPAWWKPRYSRTGHPQLAYEITAESEPAPMGRSLRWAIQLDGDSRRNEFLNSPWVRVCLPIRPGREHETIAWLAEHVEGKIGYDPQKAPLKKLLDDITGLRAKQSSLGVKGPEYVAVDSTVGAPSSAVSAESVYPIIHEFDVTVPTDGFVYDELKVVD